MRRPNDWLIVLLIRLLAACLLVLAIALPLRAARVKDLASIEGVRDNMLVGYGLVVGLNGTGDRQQTVFSTQSLSNLLQKMGVNVSPTSLRVNNIAAVMTTAELPAFARPGQRIDVLVSSIGDARSLQGGTLVLTSLKAATGEVYAVAQGPLSIGGFAAGNSRGNVQVNHPTAGRIPGGALVERAAPTVEPDPGGFRLQLHRPDFATASRIKDSVQAAFPAAQVEAESAGAVMVRVPRAYEHDPVAFIAQLHSLEVVSDRPAKVVLNERTGTVVIGSDVRIAPVAVLHGNLTVQIVNDLLVSQPGPFSQGETAVVPQTTVQATEEPAREVLLKDTATVEELVRSLMAIGSTPRDIIAIMQSISAAGALDAELEVM